MFSFSNYNVWGLVENQFDSNWLIEEKIKFLIQYGVMAPSCHNTQPWKFKIVGDCLEIYADNTRMLPIADPAGRGLYISLGCCLENIIIASQHFGLSPDVNFSNPVNSDQPVIKIKFEIKNSDSFHNELFSFISEHKMNKFDYLPNRTLELNYLDSLRQIIKDMDKVKLYVGNVDEEINQVADLVGRATAAAFRNKNFRRELSLWLRNNFTFKSDGMPMFTNGLPWTLSFLVPKLMPFINPSAPLSKKTISAVRSSSGFGILGAQSDDFHAWIQVGQSFQRINLFSYKFKLSVAIMGAPIEVDSYPIELRKLLKLDFKPMLFFRIGYARHSAKHSPRRGLKEVLFK